MYVGTGKLGRLGRLARAHGLSRLRGLRGLGQDVYFDPTTGNDTFNPITDLPTSGDIPTIVNPAGLSVPQYGGYSGASGGGLTPAEAAVITSGITGGTQVLTKALSPTPSLTYNPYTGSYTSIAGAPLPNTSSFSSALSSASISSYLPLLLLAGGALALVMVMGKR
jgi:hypothetical protein